ncbi:FMN reductase [Bacteroidia bacterium]|nr:FMN reductase [Bacteroidia bacterium]GHT62899.1 FMN reductase [Bacteroidia bacterium]GHU80232.1 FMN reductase [Bacteroidia bacterium]
MKVIAINGSPHKGGNTAYALKQVGAELQKEGIEFEIIEVGGQHLHGCIGCNKCAEKQNEKCTFTNDIVNEAIVKMKEADGIVIGSPVYYSGIAGTMKCFLDRAFFVAAVNGNLFRHKVGASVVAVRRTGGSMTFNGLNLYLSISEMLVPSSNYWNVIHGLEPGDAAQDAEGVQIMQMLGKNMAWMLKMREASKNMEPAKSEKIFTNFIR